MIGRLTIEIRAHKSSRRVFEGPGAIPTIQHPEMFRIDLSVQKVEPRNQGRCGNVLNRDPLDHVRARGTTPDPQASALYPCIRQLHRNIAHSRVLGEERNRRVLDHGIAHVAVAILSNVNPAPFRYARP